MIEAYHCLNMRMVVLVRVIWNSPRLMNNEDMALCMNTKLFHNLGNLIGEPDRVLLPN